METKDSIICGLVIVAVACRNCLAKTALSQSSCIVTVGGHTIGGELIMVPMARLFFFLQLCYMVILRVSIDVDDLFP